MNRAVLAIATNEGIMVLKPGDESSDYKTAARGLLNRNCSCIARVGDGRIAAGTDDFFVQLSKDGLEWKTSLDGINRQQITSLARHPKHAQLLFCGTCAPAVFMSADNGQSWKALAPLESLPSASRWTAPQAPYKARVSAICCHSEHSGVILAAIHTGGLAASKDGGKSWITRDTGLPPDVRLLHTPAVAGRIYAGTGSGFFRSDDLGGTWQECNKGLPFDGVEAMTVASSNPDLIILSVKSRSSGHSALVQSQDGGKSWETTSAGLPPMDRRVVKSLIFGRGGFYAGTDHGDLFGLDNLEGKWTRLGTNLPQINAMVALA